MRRSTGAGAGSRVSCLATHNVVLENKDGRLLEDRMEARIGRGGRGKDLGSVALETLCDVTLALRSLSLSWRFADPNWPPRRRLTLTQQVINRSHAASPTGGPDLPRPHHHQAHRDEPTRCSIQPPGRPGSRSNGRLHPSEYTIVLLAVCAPPSRTLGHRGAGNGLPLV